MEDNEDADSKKSEAPNLGKLEYSLDYDFQKQEVKKNSKIRFNKIFHFDFI